jgi:8-oxo-dGTP diphosphatase
LIQVDYSFTMNATIAVTVDIVVLTIREQQLHALLVERGVPPYEGVLALPGGFIRSGEDADRAAARELGEETGLDGARLHIEQLRTYSAPDRDPRGRVITIAYLAIAPDLPSPAAGTDARHAVWCPVDGIAGGEVQLAFDHAHILRDGLDRARAKLEYTTLAAAFCSDTFTVGDLRHVYEIVWGTTLDPRNFHRKVLKTIGFIEHTNTRRALETGRPATLYRRGPAVNLYPPMMRSDPDARTHGPITAGGNGLSQGVPGH